MKVGIVRCERCSNQLYTSPNGVKPGERCMTPIPPEYLDDQTVIRLCPGTFKRVRA